MNAASMVGVSINARASPRGALKKDEGIYYMARVTTALNYPSKYELLRLGEY